jgi:hypothetical protein
VCAGRNVGTRTRKQQHFETALLGGSGLT